MKGKWLKQIGLRTVSARRLCTEACFSKVNKQLESCCEMNKWKDVDNPEFFFRVISFGQVLSRLFIHVLRMYLLLWVPVFVVLLKSANVQWGNVYFVEDLNSSLTLTHEIHKKLNSRCNESGWTYLRWRDTSAWTIAKKYKFFFLLNGSKVEFYSSRLIMVVIY